MTPGSGLVASLVVVPLLAADAAPLGAVYFACEELADIDGIKDPLLVGWRAPMTGGWSGCWAPDRWMAAAASAARLRAQRLQVKRPS
jgi:hypothetical protein